MNLIVPAVCDDLGLDPYEFRVYSHLCRRTGSDGVAFGASKGMAETCRMSERSVRNALKSLVLRGLIVAENRPGMTTVYRVLPLPNPGTTCRGSSDDEAPTGVHTPAPGAAPSQENQGTPAPHAGVEGEPRHHMPHTPAPGAYEGIPLKEGIDIPTGYLSMGSEKETLPVGAFVPPQFSEVASYMAERNKIEDTLGEAEAFIAHFENRKWRVVQGRTTVPMSNWRLSVVTWERNYLQRKQDRAGPVSSRRPTRETPEQKAMRMLNEFNQLTEN